VMEALGDRRSAAIAKGDLARLRARKGEVEQALALQEERLATHRALGEADGIGAALWDIAQLHLRQERVGDAVPCIVEAYPIFERLGRAAGIAAIGPVYGQILIARDRRDEGLAVLQRSAQAARMIGWAEQATNIDNLRQTLENDEADAGQT